MPPDKSAAPWETVSESIQPADVLSPFQRGSDPLILQRAQEAWEAKLAGRKTLLEKRRAAYIETHGTEGPFPWETFRRLRIIRKAIAGGLVALDDESLDALEDEFIMIGGRPERFHNRYGPIVNECYLDMVWEWGNEIDMQEVDSPVDALREVLAAQAMSIHAQKAAGSYIRQNGPFQRDHIHFHREQFLTRYRQDFPENRLKNDELRDIADSFIVEGQIDESSIYQLRRRYLEMDQRYQPSIRRLYLELGLATMLLAEDWQVDRTTEIYAEMGMPDLAICQRILLESLERRGVDLDARQTRIPSFDVGPGTGISGEINRGNKKERHQGKTMSVYFEEFGVADRLYFSLPDIIQRHVLPADEWPEDIDEKDFQEFLRVALAWIIDEINRARRNGEKTQDESSLYMQSLLSEINPIKAILMNLESYIPGLAHKIEHPHVFESLEFQRDELKDMPAGCRDLFSRFYLLPANERLKISDFFHKNFFEKYYDLRTQMRIYPHNIYLSRFEDIDEEVIPRIPPLGIVRAKRSSSHLTDEAFLNLERSVMEHLMPGGLVVGSDGHRESYTRYDRLEALHTLVENMGEEYRLHVRYILNDGGPVHLSYLIERAVMDERGDLQFLTEEELKAMTLDDCQISPVGQERFEGSVAWLRNKITEHVRHILVGDEHDGDMKLIDIGRSGFKGLHTFIDESARRYHTDYTDDGMELDQVLSCAVDDLIEVDYRFKRVLDVHDSSGLFAHGTDTTQIVCLNPWSNPDPFFNLLSDTVTWNQALLTGNLHLETDEEALFALLINLQKLYAKTGKAPLVNVKMFGCYTNKDMESALRGILGECYEKYVEEHVLGAGSDAHEFLMNLDSSGRIILIGGSYQNANDKLGRSMRMGITRRAEQIKNNRLASAFYGTCFGHDCLLTGMADLYSRTSFIFDGPLQIAQMPIQLTAEWIVPEHLRGGMVDMIMSRGSYANAQFRANEVSVWAMEPPPVNTPGHSHSMRKRPPIGVSFDNFGIGCKAHMEATPPSVLAYVDSNIHMIQEVYRGPEHDPTHPEKFLRAQTDVQAVDRYGQKKAYWKSSSFNSIMPSQLNHLAEGVLQRLSS